MQAARTAQMGNAFGGTMRRLAGVLFALAWLCVPALAQDLSNKDWPSKTVRIIVPFGAGATPDIIARIIAEKLQQSLNQTFIVENKPGASGMTGTDAVAKAEPDGYTIGISIGGPLAINTLLFSQMPHDSFKDLAVITMLNPRPRAVAGPAEFGITSSQVFVGGVKKGAKKNK